jgi:hypothetical protein
MGTTDCVHFFLLSISALLMIQMHRLPSWTIGSNPSCKGRGFVSSGASSHQLGAVVPTP